MGRETRIGGSEIAILTGMKPFGKTPLDLFKSKMGFTVTKDIDAFYWGHALESVVLKRFAEDMGKGVDVLPGPDAMTEQVEGNEPWQGTSPDGYVKVNDLVIDIIEIKTTSMEKWTKAPEEYLLQMLWNIGITRQVHPSCEGCYMPSLHNTNRYQFKYYSYEGLGGDEKFNELNALAKGFYEDHLITGIAPNPTKYEESAEAYRLAKGILDIDDKELDKVLHYVYAIEGEEEKVKTASDNISELKFKLSEMMGSYKKLVHDGTWVVSRVSSANRVAYIKVNKKGTRFNE